MPGLKPGDPPRLVPQLPHDSPYWYLGLAVQLDGQHGPATLARLLNKQSGTAAQVAPFGHSRKQAVSITNGGTLGSALYYGCAFGGSFSMIDRTLGAAQRRAIHGRGVRGWRRRVDSSRLGLHAPERRKADKANDPATRL